MMEPSKPLVMMSAAELEALLDRVISEKLAAQPTAPAPDTWPELLSRAQAAEFLQCSKGSIDNWTRSGLLKKHFLGKAVRFRRDELRAVFDSWKDGRG